MLLDCWTDNIRKIALSEMMFVDEVILCSNTREEVQNRLEVWRRALEERGMKIGRQRTECLSITEEREKERSIKTARCWYVNG